MAKGAAKRWALVAMVGALGAGIWVFGRPALAQVIPISASGEGTYKLVSIARVVRENYPQPPERYGRVNLFPALQYQEAVAYFELPPGETVPRNAAPVGDGLRAWVVPDERLPVPLEVMPAGRQLFRVQFPVEWPKSVRNIKLIVRGKHGQSRYAVLNWRGPRRSDALLPSTRRRAPRDWIDAWIVKRESEKDRPAVAATLKPKLENNRLSYQVKDCFFKTTTGYVVGGHLTMPSVDQAPTVGFTWHEAEALDRLVAFFTLVTFQKLESAPVVAERVESQSDAWVYSVDLGRLGRASWTLKKKPEYGYREGTLSMDRPISDAGHVEVQWAGDSKVSTVIEKGSLTELFCYLRASIEPGQRIVGRAVTYAQVSTTDYCSVIDNLKKRETRASFPFENSMAPYAVSFEP